MRRPKLPAATPFRCVRAHQGFNGGANNLPTFAEHISGARPVTSSCLSSPQGHATRQSSHRSVLRMATPSPRQLSMMVCPSSGRSYRAKSLAGTFKLCWGWGHTRTKSEAGPLRRLHPSTPGCAHAQISGLPQLPQLGNRKYHAQHAPISYRYLRNSLLQSEPSADTPSPTMAKIPPPRRNNRKLKTTLDEDTTSNRPSVDSRKTSRKASKERDKEVKTSIARLARSVVSRTKLSNDADLSGDAVIIFLRKSRPDGGHDSDIFERASALFGREQLVEVTVPWRRRPGILAPPELDKVRLRGEKRAAVPVFDSCDEIRAKLDAYLSHPQRPTRAHFCSVLHAQLKATSSKGIWGIQLQLFRSKQGLSAGNNMSIYYAAYIFFEKLRIAEGRPKSSHRLEMERLYPRGLECKRV